MAEPLDTRRYVETPEGVEVGLDLAGPMVRAWAWTIDIIIRGVLNIAAVTVLALASILLGDAGFGFILLWTFLLEWFYPVFFEARFGATPGKMAMGLVVLHDDGTPGGGVQPSSAA